MMGFLGVSGEGGRGSAALGDGEEEFRPFIRRLPGTSARFHLPVSMNVLLSRLLAK
jgi:hypothetical protein